MASVELVNLEKTFGDTRVVRGLDLRVESGEFLVLVGPSGCGKSTVLRLIAGLEDCTAGEIRIDECAVNDVAPKDRGVGMVFQSYALYPHMSVRENLAFGLTLRKLPAAAIRGRVDDVARMLGLEPLLDRKPKALSGGQRQRVAMGRAIVRDPKVFLFDEPLSNLDAALRVQLRAELAALHARLGATMIYVTHDQVEAMTLATRIAVLEGGVLQQVGPALELFHRPANRFVAGFIGAPAMSFLEGSLVDEAGRVAFASAHVRLLLRPIEGRAGDRLSLGVRPHDVGLGEGPFSGVVEVVERMGWEAFVHLRVGSERLIARAVGELAARLRPGEVLPFRLDPARVHLFAAQGPALLAPAESGQATPRAAVR